MRRKVAFLLLVVVAAGVVLGLVFAGSPTTIADGVHVDGVDVGGLSATQARELLEGKAAALSSRPRRLHGGRTAVRHPALGAGRPVGLARSRRRRAASGLGLRPSARLQAPRRGRLRRGRHPADERPQRVARVRARSHRERREPAAARRVARPARDTRRRRPGADGPDARPLGRRDRARPRARHSRSHVRPGLAPDAHDAAARARGRASARRPAGAHRSVGAGEPRCRAEAVPPDARAARAAPRASVRRNVRLADRRPRRGRVAAQARRAHPEEARRMRPSPSTGRRSASSPTGPASASTRCGLRTPSSPRLCGARPRAASRNCPSRPLRRS